MSCSPEGSTILVEDLGDLEEAGAAPERDYLLQICWTGG